MPELPWGLYARISSDEQRKGRSIDGQRRELREWANRKGHSYLEFVDEGHSAWVLKSDQRPAFNEALDALRAREIAGLAVTHYDRFGRDTYYTLGVLLEMKKYGSFLVVLEESDGPIDFDRPSDVKDTTNSIAEAEYHSSKLSVKVKRGLRERARKGLHVGTTPIGYCNGKCPGCADGCTLWKAVESGNPIILHPSDAVGVKRAFDLYLTGNYTDPKVADALNNVGYRSRTREGRKLWNKNSVRWVLTNPTYAGLVAIKGQIFAGNHPAIITREVFDEVQSIRERHLLKPRSSTPNLRTYLFGGILICSGCGHVMNAQPYSGKRLRGYVCRSADRRRSECKRVRKIVRADVLEDQFGALLKEFKLPEGWQAQILRALAEGSTVIDREAECRRLSTKLDRLKILFEDGDKILDDYRRERNNIRAQLDALKAPETNETIDAGMLLESLGAVWDAANLAERKEIVNSIITRAICDSDQKRLTAFFVKPVFLPFFRNHPALRAHPDGALEFLKQKE